jgi:hypothetical protein
MSLRLFAVLPVGLTSPPVAQTKPFEPSSTAKKLIQYGWDCPNTAYLRENIARTG